MFIFKGISSQDMGIEIKELPPISSSEENTETFEADGMDGSIVQSLGYKNTKRSITCYSLFEDPYSLMDWLRGSGELILGNEPDFYFKARINNKISLSEYIDNDVYEFPVIFDCLPFRYYIVGKSEVDITNEKLIYNVGNYFSLPIIKIKGRGSVTATINDKSFTVKDLNGWIVIDSTNEEAYDLNGNNLGEKMVGDFPIFIEKSNKICYNGSVEKIITIPNWRRL